MQPMNTSVMEVQVLYDEGGSTSNNSGGGGGGSGVQPALQVSSIRRSCCVPGMCVSKCASLFCSHRPHMKMDSGL